MIPTGLHAVLPILGAAAREGGGTSGWVYVPIAIGILVLLVMIVVVISFFNLWIQAFAAGARVAFIELIGMKFRKVNSRLVVDQRIMAMQAGIDYPVRGLEAHYLALGGQGRGEQMIPILVRSLITAHKAGASVEARDLESFQLAGGDVGLVVNALVAAHKAGLPVQVGQLQAHFLAGGRVEKVVNALISAMRAGIPLDFQKAAAIDLAGRDVEEAVHTSVNPKVIDCPNPATGKETVAGVAKDGIEVKAKARVTVRANIERLIGGATEETIIARVGEGISARESSPPSAPPAHTRKSSRTPTPSPRSSSVRASTPEPPTKSSRLTSATSTSGPTSAPGSRPTRPRPTSKSHRPRPRSGERSPWPASKK